jgi:L-malate glycosyltransferase
MACSVPVIAPELGGIKEYLIPGENGLFFEPTVHGDLLKKLQFFHSLSDREKKQMSLNALATASEFETRKVSKILGSELNSLLSN